MSATVIDEQIYEKDSSIAERIHKANASFEEKQIWAVAVSIIIALLSVHCLSHFVVEYGFLDGTFDYSNTPKEESSDNQLSMTDSAPTAKLDDSQFQLYMAFVMYGTVVLTGELFVRGFLFHLL